MYESIYKLLVTLPLYTTIIIITALIIRYVSIEDVWLRKWSIGLVPHLTKTYHVPPSINNNLLDISYICDLIFLGKFKKIFIFNFLESKIYTAEI